jgi:hypothetical protein
MKRRVFFIVLILTICTVSTITAQQVISSAGASATGTGVQLSWTIGEPVIETFTGTSAILTQGFHQSKLTVTAVDPTLFPGLDVSVYPNPVSTQLRYKISGERIQNLSYRLFNAEGKAILNKTVENPEELINMEIYTSGIYLLKFFRQDDPLKTFKIIKD